MLCGICCGTLACLQAQDQKPATFALQPLTLRSATGWTKSEGLLRVFGNPETRADAAVGKAVWIADGTRMYTSGAEGTGRGIQVWRPNADGLGVTLDGTLPLGFPWAVSPDGAWVFGEHEKGGFQLHNARTLEGAWALGEFPQVLQAEFSRSGEWLALVHYRDMAGKSPGTIQVSVFSVKDRSRKIVLPVQARSQFIRSDRYDVAFLDDGLWLAPVFDTEGRICRVSLPDGKIVPMTPAVDYQEGPRLGISDDGQWLVSWGNDAYHIFKKTGSQFQPHLSGTAPRPSDLPVIFIHPGFNSVQFTPDSKQVIISGARQHKVIHLNDRRVVHEDTTSCLCGIFGRGRDPLFWNTCAPFTAVRPGSWTPVARSDPGHRDLINSIAFSPDGRWLATQSPGSIWLWDVKDPETPPRNLVPPVSDFWFGRAVWSPDGTELWAGDGYGYLKWKVNARPAADGRLVGELLFHDDFDRGTRSPAMQFLCPVPSSGACIITGNISVLRQPGKTEIVRSLRIPDGLPHPVTLSNDETELFWVSLRNQSLVAMSLKDLTRRPAPAPTGGILAGKLADGRLVCVDQRAVNIVDPSVLRVVTSSAVPRGRRLNSTSQSAAASPDGRWISTTLIEDNAGLQPAQQILADITGPKVRFAALPDMNAEFRSAAFSPDGKLLAVGLVSGVVTLWDVAALDRMAAVPPEPPAPVPKAPVTFNGFPWESEDWPAEAILLPRMDSWRISPDGMVMCREASLTAGAVRIDGAEPRVLGMRSYMTSIPIPPGQFNPDPGRTPPGHTVVGEIEMRAAGDKVRLVRNIRAHAFGSLRWHDTLENLSGEPATFTYEHIAEMGGTSHMQSPQGTPVAVGPNGALTAPQPLTSIITRRSIGNVERFVEWQFATAAAPHPPVVRWQEATKSITAGWKFTLRPHEKKVVMVRLSQQYLQPGIHPAPTTLVTGQDNAWTPRIAAVANASWTFRTDAEKEAGFKRLGLNSDGTESDGMGFRWLKPPVASFGMGAAFGADRLFELWLDGSPAAFETLVTDVLEGTSRRQFVPELRTVDGVVRAQRRIQFKKETGLLIMHDTIINGGTTPRRVKVELPVVALDHFSRLETPAGRSLSMAGNVLFKEYDGQFALVSPGEDKPAILLSVGSAGAAVQPFLKTSAAGRAVFLCYELDLAPGERVPLLHIATQRPFSAYEKSSEAFAEFGLPALFATGLPANWAPAMNWTAHRNP